MQEKQLLLEEYGSSYKPGASVRTVIAFPNSYYLGMSSLGFQVILDEINRHPDASCERVFFEEDKPGAVLRSLETQHLLSEFDIIAFSISFELDCINVVKILNASNIPLRSGDRDGRDPIVIAGGINPTFNPEPISDFVDAFVIGDGEEVIHGLISEYQGWRQQKDKSRQDLLNRLSRIEGVYVPLIYDVKYKEDGSFSGIYSGEGDEPVIRSFSVSDLDKYDTVSRILTPNTEFACFFLVEVARGCAHRCRFCVASHVQRCRIRSEESIFRLCQSELAKRAEKIGLLGSSVSDHPRIDEIAKGLVDMGNRISIASLRVDSVSSALLDALASSDQRTITLAPEAASPRLRRVIGKDIPQETTFEVIRSAVSRGMANVKLYFMIGLPAETQEDLDDMVRMVEDIRQLMFASPRPRPSRSPNLTISISPFVPKPHTPFQWCRMEDANKLSKKLQFLRQSLSKIGGVRVTYTSPKWSAVQGVLARGDRRLAGVLCDVAQKAMSWNQALRKNGLSYSFYLQRTRGFNELFPWDHLDLGMPKARLLDQFLSTGVIEK